MSKTLRYYIATVYCLYLYTIYNTCTSYKYIENRCERKYVWSYRSINNDSFLGNEQMRNSSLLFLENFAFETRADLCHGFRIHTKFL